MFVCVSVWHVCDMNVHIAYISHIYVIAYIIAYIYIYIYIYADVPHIDTRLHTYAMHSCTHTSTEVQNKLYRLNARTKLVRQELIAEVLEPNTYRHTCTQV